MTMSIVIIHLTSWQLVQLSAPVPMLIPLPSSYLINSPSLPPTSLSPSLLSSPYRPPSLPPSLTHSNPSLYLWNFSLFSFMTAVVLQEFPNVIKGLKTSHAFEFCSIAMFPVYVIVKHFVGLEYFEAKTTVERKSNIA